MRRILLFGFLRDEAQDGTQGGGAGGGADGGKEKPPADPNARLAALEKELGDYKRKEREAKETEERSKGEWNSVIKRYEADLVEERNKRSEAEKRSKELEDTIGGFHKEKREGAFSEALAQHLGVSMSPRLRGLLPQTGLDTAPEKFDADYVKKVAAKIRELDPELKPSGKPIGNGAGGTPIGSDGKTDWRAVGAALAAGKL